MEAIKQIQDKFDKEIYNLDKTLDGPEVEMEILRRWVQLLFGLLIDMSEHFESLGDHDLHLNKGVLQDLQSKESDQDEVVDKLVTLVVQDSDLDMDHVERNSPGRGTEGEIYQGVMDESKQSTVPCVDENLSSLLFVDVAIQCNHLIETENQNMTCKQTQTENVGDTPEKVIEFPSSHDNTKCCEDTAIEVPSLILPTASTQPEKETDLSPSFEISRKHKDSANIEISILHSVTPLPLNNSANCTALSPTAKPNDKRPSLEKQAVNKMLIPQDTTSYLLVNSETSSDSDSSFKKTLFFTKAQQEAWRNKKSHFRRTYYSSPSSCEVKIRQKWRASRGFSDVPRHVTTERNLLTRMPTRPKKYDNDDSVWIVGKAMNYKTNDGNDIGMLHILKVSANPPCSVQKKAIGLICLNKFNLPSCLKKSC